MTLRLVVLWAFLGVLAAFGLYTVKYRVQAIKSEVATAETQLREEKKNLHVLNAEWTYLNRPERLRQLSEKYLTTNKPMNGQQLSELASLPYPGLARAPQTQPASQTVPPAHFHPHLAKGVTLASRTVHAQ